MIAVLLLMVQLSAPYGYADLPAEASLPLCDDGCQQSFQDYAQSITDEANQQR
jgi:hypothetical protein